MAGTIVAATLYATVAAGFRWLDERLQVIPPAVEPRDVYSALFDLKPITVTVTAGIERVQRGIRRCTTFEPTGLCGGVCTLPTGTPSPADLRHEALDNMLGTISAYPAESRCLGSDAGERLGSGAAADSHRRLSGDGGVLDGLLPRWREVPTCRHDELPIPSRPS